MDFVVIALICTNVALLSEVISTMVFKRKVARLLELQSNVNKTQLLINKNLIGIKEEI